MSAAFGTPLDHVRIHTDANARSRTTGADAYAVTEGADIFLAEDAYAPESEAGEALLAHELTHVVQQTAPGSGSQRIDDVRRDEHEADQVASVRDWMRGRWQGLRDVGGIVSAGRSVLRPRACSRAPSREEMNETITRADQITRTASAVTTGEMQTQLERASRATGFARRNVGRFNNIMDHLDRAQRIYEAVQALNRIQNPDGSFSDGRAAAQQFDKLFSALGEVLESTGVPGASSYGTLLKQCGSFFENMEAKLNPARRWEHREDWREAMRH